MGHEAARSARRHLNQEAAHIARLEAGGDLEPPATADVENEGRHPPRVGILRLRKIRDHSQRYQRPRGLRARSCAGEAATSTKPA